MQKSGKDLNPCRFLRDSHVDALRASEESSTSKDLGFRCAQSHFSKKFSVTKDVFQRAKRPRNLRNQLPDLADIFSDIDGLALPVVLPTAVWTLQLATNATPFHDSG